MREILFRAKRKDKNEWVYGYYVYSSLGNHFIFQDRKDEYFDKFHPFQWCEAIPETVGQYTGLKDKKGKKIFEGDIVRFMADTIHYQGVVRFNNASFYINDGRCSFYRCLVDYTELKILGNRWDNPELVKEER